MKASEIEQILRKKNEYFPADFIQGIEQERINAIKAKDEENANRYWCYAVIYYVQKGFLTLYQLIKMRNYTKAWETLKETDLQLMTLEQNFDIDSSKDDPYHLTFIKNMLLEYQKLFPYEYFVGREEVVTKQRCTICGETVKLRGGCSHVPGKIYMGELCMHEKIDSRYLDMKVFYDPFDKYEYLQPYESEQLNLNFGMLEGLMRSIKSPFDYWYVEVVKEKNPEFARIGRNDKCPCGSGKKFKHCCMNDEEKMYFDHYKIKMMNDVDEKVAQPLQIL